MNTVFDVLLYPFRTLDPLWGMMWISALTGVMMILIFKGASNQHAISELRRRMGSRALGMLLYLESPATVLKLAGGLIADNFIYLWHLLRPMLVIAVPFVLVAAQLDARYGYLPPGDGRPHTAVIRWESSLPSSLGQPVSGELVSPVLTVADSLEKSFSFTGENGLFTMDDPAFKTGSSGGAGSVVVRGAEPGGIIASILRPWNAVSPTGVSSVKVYLTPADYGVLGGRWSWFAVFLVFSSLWAIAGAVVFKVKV